MTIKVGINGMGRIGRMVIRAIIESQNKNIEIKHINNRSNSEASCSLIKYDSIHGKFNADLDYDEKHLIINKNKITFSQESNIEDINWKKFDVDYVFECTGKFNSKEKLLTHIKNGAKKVIVSAPCKNADKTIVYGVNENILTKDDQIISAASCTTNCLAPVANVLNETFEIEKGFMTTIHAFTSDQRILDNSHKDPRRARSASQSIIPTSTGASKAIGEIIPSLKGKLEGVAMRVPTPNVSLIELVFCTKKEITKEKLLAHIRNGAKKVIVSAPCKNADKTIVYGVNEDILKKEDQIISAASCTTNCLAPVANVLNETFEIEKGFMTTIHAFTSDQRILDNSHKDPRRARSASQSIIPTSTGASKAIGEIIPSLKGKLEGVAMRVPTPNVSLVELVFCTKKEMTKETINEAFIFASKKQSKKVLEVTLEKLVSIDFNHNSASAIVDLSLTNVVGKNMGKISAWYDNEWGFSNRMCDIAEYLHKIS